MCSSKPRLQDGAAATVDRINPSTKNSYLNGRPVLQATGINRIPLLERRDSLNYKKLSSPKYPPLQPLSPPKYSNANNAKSKPNSSALAPVSTPPISPKLRSSRPPSAKRSVNDPNGLNSSSEKVSTPRGSTNKLASIKAVKKSKKCGGGGGSSGDLVVRAVDAANASLKLSSSLMKEAPGSIAAARREKVAIMQVQRKMRIAHYGRTKSAKYEAKVAARDSGVSASAPNAAVREETKRCSFITSNSDPIYVAYHDEEWGVPVHDDRLLFELLVLTGAQVGSDWTSVLKKRQDFRDAFAGFDVESVSVYSEKKITSVSADLGIDLSQVRGAVDNAKRILEIKKEFGTLDKYLWGFVNHKPMETQYKSSQRIPVKTSKSEAMSKGLVRRGFRYVGPTVLHSFMQAAGLTNGHLLACPRHLQCLAVPPAS